jgi:hypothetical protein
MEELGMDPISVITLICLVELAVRLQGGINKPPGVFIDTGEIFIRLSGLQPLE